MLDIQQQIIVRQKIEALREIYRETLTVGRRIDILTRVLLLQRALHDEEGMAKTREAIDTYKRTICEGRGRSIAG